MAHEALEDQATQGQLPPGVASYTSWGYFLYLLGLPPIPPGVTSYTSWGYLLYPLGLPPIPPEVASYTSWGYLLYLLKKASFCGKLS